MEKAAKKLRALVSIILVGVLLCVGFWAAAKFTNITGFFSRIFGTSEIDVYAFDGADTNTNGGLTRKEIGEQKDNADCPTLPDVNDIIYIQDYNDFVCFYKETTDADGNTIYPNIVFVKTDDGLKFNGALNIVGHINSGWLWGGYSYYVEQRMDLKPVYIDQFILKDGWGGTNLFLVNTYNEDYLLWSGGGPISGIVNGINRKQDRLTQTKDYVLQNIYPYFLKFCNNHVEIIQDQQDKKVADGDFNFFYDYLYRSAKNFDYDSEKTSGTCAVDVTNLTVYPLPEDLKTTYPIPNTQPTEYFGIYKVNVFLTCHYEKLDVTSKYNGNDSLKKFIEDDPITYQQIETNTLCDISAKLMPKTSYYNAVIANVVKDNPVTITFYDSNGDEYRKIVFDENSFVSALGSKKSAFEKGTYTYTIESNQIIFDAYSGTIEITKSGEIKFNYTYLDGKVLSNISIAPVSNDVDYSDIDLATYPVRIILNSEDKTQTYQFVFDSQAKVAEVQSSLMPIGKYTYTILSEKLVFGSTSGSIEIKPKMRNFEFTFGVAYNQSDLAFSVTFSEIAAQDASRFEITCDPESAELIIDKVNTKEHFYFHLEIYDVNSQLVDGRLVIDRTSMNGKFNDTYGHLIVGNSYTAIIYYWNDTSNAFDDHIEYQVGTISFVYKANTLYTFTYSCTEVD